MAKISLLDVYQQAFGYRAIPAVGLQTTAQVPASSKLDEISVSKTYNEDESGQFTRSSSTMGVPFFMPIKIDGFQLPNEPIVTIRGNKTIIKTPIDGNEGTFKQHYALGDYLITIKGICILDEDSEEYPEEQVRALRKIIEKRNGLDVVCRLLSIWNVNHLAIEGFDFPAIEGAPGMQPYELTCSSDKYFDLELLEGND